MQDKKQSDCPGYYEVSGYTTKDGTKVDSYMRNCWKHGGGASGSGVQNTQESIDKTNEKLDEINNKKTITDEDLDLSKGYLYATISKICEDCENYLEESKNKPETLTWESIEKAKALKNIKDHILDNIDKSIFTVNKIEKIQKKKWDTINTSDEGYNNKLYEYTKSRETIENINKNLRYLHEAVSNSWGIAKNYINDLRISSNEITEQVIPTGYAANLKNNTINNVKNFINHGGKNGNPVWFNPEPNSILNKIISQNIISYFSLWPETNKRLEKFYERPDINITNEEKDIKNDMRHITGLAFYTQLYGPFIALKSGYLKEFRDMIREFDKEDTMIDLSNNIKGIKLGMEYPNLTRDELIEKIYEIYIKPKRLKKY